MTLKEIITNAILDALERHAGDRTKAAHELQCHPKTIRNYIRRLKARGITAPRKVPNKKKRKPVVLPVKYPKDVRPSGKEYCLTCGKIKHTSYACAK